MKCVYEKCGLPKNNNKYAWQVAYLFVSLAYLLKDSRQFNFFSLFLFVMPVLMDLLFGPFEGRFLRAVRKIAITINMVLILVCILGLFSIIVDSGESFEIVSTAMIFANFSIKKSAMIGPLVADLVVPFMYFKGAPNQQTMKVKREISEAHKRGGA